MMSVHAEEMGGGGEARPSYAYVRTTRRIGMFDQQTGSAALALWLLALVLPAICATRDAGVAGQGAGQGSVSCLGPDPSDDAIL